LEIRKLQVLLSLNCKVHLTRFSREADASKGKEQVDNVKKSERAMKQEKRKDLAVPDIGVRKIGVLKQDRESTEYGGVV